MVGSDRGELDAYLLRELCKEGTFDDYAVDRPLYDADRILMAIYHGLRRREGEKKISLLYQRLQQFKGKLGPLDESLKIMLEHSSDKQSGMVKRFAVFMDRLHTQLRVVEERLAVSDLCSEPFVEQIRHQFELFFTQFFTPGRASLQREMNGLEEMIDEAGQQFKEYLAGIQALNTESRNTILLVDDDPFFREHLTELLDNAGYNTIEASSGEQAVRELESRSPDLILLDYDMPEMNGVETIHEIRQDVTHQGVPIVMLTGFSQSSIVKDSFRAGAAGYIIKKSIEQSDFLTRVNQYIHPL